MMPIKNEDGFTLISTLFIMVLIVFLLPLLISLITTASASYETTYDDLSIQQFFVFLRDELFMATNYEIRTNALILDLPDGKKSFFMQVGDHIVRRLSGGYEIFLRDIDRVMFSEWSDGIHVNITSLEGEQYEKILRFYKE